VRKKVLAVLASWSRQFKDDRSAAGIAGLYRQVKPATESTRGSEANREGLAERERESEIRRREKEESKRKVKEKRKKLEEARSKKAAFRTALSRKQFNFERVRVPVALTPSPSSDSRPIQEKPEVLTAIANASAAANNLVNAITVRLSRFRCWLACSCLTEARQHRERQSGIERTRSRVLNKGQADPQGHRSIYSSKSLFLFGLSYLIPFPAGRRRRGHRDTHRIERTHYHRIRELR
jgi:hypothetical protein